MPINKYPADPTLVVAIVGTGKRDEIVINKAQGEGLDGEPFEYNSKNRPDGRHFKLSAYPVVLGSIEVIKKTRNRISSPDIEADVIEPLFTDEQFGYVILRYPLEPGEQLRVRYTASFDQNNPRLFTDEQLPDIYSLYGPQSLDNTISVGATIAITNGAKYILAVLGGDLNTDPDWSETFDILKNESPYYVVPLPPQRLSSKGFPIPEPPIGYSSYSAVTEAALQAVEQMSSTSERNEAALIVGQTGQLTVEKAKEIFGSSERVMFAGPDTMQYFIQGQLQTLDGRFLAPVLAGMLASSQLTFTPMGKQAQGVIVGQTFKKSAVELKQLVADGQSYFLPAQAGAKLNRAVTTSQSRNAVLEEPSVLRVRDYLINLLRNQIAQQFVGVTIQTGLEKKMESEMIELLNRQVNNRLITTYQNVIVKKDALEPRQVNISFDFEPIFPLIFISVSFNVQLL